MKRLGWIVLVLFLCSSCATMESLNQYYAEIDLKDGVDRDEAKLIAKKYLVESQYEGEYQVFAPMVWSDDHSWVVTFIYKSLTSYEQFLDVYVDTLTGEVKKTEIRHKTTPPLTVD